jgi:ankyrin repeat protein
MIAASAGGQQIVADLIARGASVNVINTTGQCPLHYTASKDRYEVSKTSQKFYDQDGFWDVRAARAKGRTAENIV